MDERPPPFYSRSRTRTRPARRRPEITFPDLTRTRRALSRRSVTVAALIAFLSLVSAALARSRGGEPLAIPADAPPGAVAVAVERVVDGDTLDVRSAETAIRVRLYGVNAPEVGQRCATDATRRLAALAGERVLLLPDARQRDTYGRELRYVFTAEGASIDEALVREGLAHAWREDGSRRDALVAAESAARTAKAGCLWASTPGSR